MVKLLRLPLASARPLLADGAVDRALLLVRDPRATMHSRQGRGTLELAANLHEVLQCLEKAVWLTTRLLKPLVIVLIDS